MNKRSGGGGSWNRRGKPSSKELSGMRRQRSLEWRNERNCSSSDEEIARPVESQIFASLLAQAQKEFKDDIERSYRSEEKEEDAANLSQFPAGSPKIVSPRSPIPLHRQASPFALESLNSRRMNYQAPPERIRTMNVAGEVIYATGNKKSLSNNTTLGRSGRRHRMGGMTSSSSATSCNSNCNDNILQPNGDISYHEQNRRLSNAEDSPPEPAPPEIPPRGGSLHSATLRRMTEYQLPPNGDVGAGEEVQYLPPDYVLGGSPRASVYPVRSPMAAQPNANNQHRIARNSILQSLVALRASGPLGITSNCPAICPPLGRLYQMFELIPL